MGWVGLGWCGIGARRPSSAPCRRLTTARHLLPTSTTTTRARRNVRGEPRVGQADGAAPPHLLLPLRLRRRHAGAQRLRPLLPRLPQVGGAGMHTLYFLQGKKCCIFMVPRGERASCQPWVDRPTTLPPHPHTHAHPPTSHNDDWNTTASSWAGPRACTRRRSSCRRSSTATRTTSWVRLLLSCPVLSFPFLCFLFCPVLSFDSFVCAIYRDDGTRVRVWGPLGSSLSAIPP